MSDVVPIKMDLSDCDFDDEVADEDVDDKKGQQGLSLKYLLTIFGTVVAAAIIIFGVLMFARNGLSSFGKPNLDNVKVTDKQSAGHGGHAAPGEDDHEFVDITTMDIDYEDAQAHTPDKKKRTKSNDKVGKVVEIGGSVFYYLNPVAVTSQTGNGKIHIYVTLAFETNKETAAALFEHGVAIKDELVLILQSMDSEAAHGWDAPHDIRSKIRRRIAEMLPDAEIQAILVQDFVAF